MDYSDKNNKLEFAEIPKHVAIIMDGNGRWALAQGKPRTWGHLQGINTVRMVVENSVKSGIKVLTLFAFSEENWGRPRDEIRQIFSLLEVYLSKELANLKEQQVQLRFIGDRERLPQLTKQVAEQGEASLQESKGMVLNIALNYGARQDMVNACKQIANAVKGNKISSSQIDEKMIARYLRTADVCEPDLLIRTGGEQRVSNFLLWEIAYTELYFCKQYWPAFSREDFFKAIASYSQRNRRFGLAKSPTSKLEIKDNI
jgi:undecaprenyl diphosphate synthase